MPKVLARTLMLKPIEYSGDVKVTLYKGEEVSWKEIEIDEEDRDKLVNEMIIEASRLAYESRVSNGYVFVCLEIPGIAVFEGEGDNSSAETIFYPRPAQVYKLVFYKYKGDKVVSVKEIVFDKDTYIYDGKLDVPSVDYDIIEVVTSEGSRILFKEELNLPITSRYAVVSEAPKKTRRTRRRRRKTSLTKKSKTRRKKRTRRKKKRRK